MIYITGDTHNTTNMSNLSSKNMKLCCMEQKTDYKNISTAIVLGDFGLPWSSDCIIDEAGIHPSNHTDRYLLKWYNQKPFKILAVIGNHDNYDLIEQLPEVEMFGAKVLKVSENVYYLKRGEIYTLENKRFLVLGGALSDDKAWRKPHESWCRRKNGQKKKKQIVLKKSKEIIAASTTFFLTQAHQKVLHLQIHTSQILKTEFSSSKIQMFFLTKKLIP